MDKKFNFNDLLYHTMQMLGGLNVDELSIHDFRDLIDVLNKAKATYIDLPYTPFTEPLKNITYEWFVPTHEYVQQEKEIKKLKEELNRMTQILEGIKKGLKEKGIDLETVIGDVDKKQIHEEKKELIFPHDFDSYFVKTPDWKGVNQTIRELMSIKLEDGQFALIDTQNGLVIKIKDKEGESIIVTHNYYIKNLDKNDRK